MQRWYLEQVHPQLIIPTLFFGNNRSLFEYVRDARIVPTTQEYRLSKSIRDFNALKECG